MPAILFVLFIVTPLVEIFVLIQVGRVVGAPLTIAALLLISLAGAALVRREGLKAWTRFRAALQAARLPAEEVVDGALVLLAGALLLTPGFVTDALGLIFLLPPSRALINRALRSRVRMSMGLGPAAPHRRSAPRRPSTSSGDGTTDGDIEVDVVDIRRTGDDPRRPEVEG